MTTDTTNDADRAALAELARALYNACQTPKPAWDQLSEVTQGVWVGYAAKKHASEPVESDNLS